MIKAVWLRKNKRDIMTQVIKHHIMKKLVYILVMLTIVLNTTVTFSQEDKVVNFTIAGPLKSLSLNVSPTNPKSFNATDGALTIIVKNGWLPYKYEVYKKGKLVKSGRSGNEKPKPAGTNYKYEKRITGLGDGSYKVVVKDAKYIANRTCNQSSVTEKLTHPPKLQVTIVNKLEHVIKCNGGVGTLTANVTGGIKGKGYKYQWYKVVGKKTSLMSGKIAATLAHQNKGFYKVKVTDANAIQKWSSTFHLKEPEVLKINSTPSIDATCNGKANGSITVKVTGGTKPYTYKWLDGVTTNRNTRSRLKKGTYSVQITDKRGCTTNYTTPIKIGEPSAIVINILDQKNPKQYKGADGYVKLIVSGGTPNYSYKWKGAKTTNSNITGNTAKNINISGLRADTYTLTVEDNKKCIINKTIKIEEPKELLVAISKTDVLCFKANNGVLQANPTGGVSTIYRYKWFKLKKGVYVSINKTSRKISNLSPGTYKVEVKDQNDVSKTAIQTIREPLQLEASHTLQNVFCKGGNNGFINLTVTGGTKPYSYKWTSSKGANFSTQQNVSSLAAGIYNVQVVDKNKCSITKQIEIKQPSEFIDINVTRRKHPLAKGSKDGEIAISVAGGTPPYSYEWRDSKNVLVGSQKNISGLGDGTYTVTVKDASYSKTTSNTGCKEQEIVLLIEPPLLEGKITVKSKLFCNGDEDGILEVEPKGGVSPYKLEWYIVEKDKTKNYISGETATTFSRLKAGTYGVKITDANRISAFEDFELTEPKKLKILPPVIKHVFCYGEYTGEIDITVEGGIQEYTYEWYDAKDKLIGKNQDIKKLGIGVYRVKVTDKNNCFTELKNITITQPQAPLAISKSIVTNLTGFETKNGNIDITISGGTAPYTYQWTKKGKTSVITNTQDIKDLPIGGYVVTVVDNKNCSVSKEYTVTQPDKLIVDIEQKIKNQCKGDNKSVLQANVKGGVKEYKYQWYNTKDDTKILGTDSKLSNLKVGTYKVVVTDKNDNRSEQKITTEEPTALALISSEIKNVTCYNGNDGKITIAVTGGTGAYSYRWSNGVITKDATNLSKGNYTVTIVDENSCSLTSKTFTVTEPDEYKLTDVVLNQPSGAGLSNGSITLNVVGGVPGYTYKWYNSDDKLIGQNKNISNLIKGAYKIVVSDSRNCLLETELLLDEPKPLEVSIIETQTIKCYSDSSSVLQAVVKGGVGGNTFEWYHATTKEMLGKGQLMYNLPVGTYYVKVKDVNNNKAESLPFKVEQPNLLEVSLSSSSKQCGSGNDWKILSKVSGGTPPYTYAWSSGQTTKDLTNVTAGNYFVVIKDANNCQVTKNIILDAGVPMQIKEKITQATCYNGCDGAISIAIEGGTKPYVIKWNTAATTQSIKGLCVGNYFVEVVDSKGCKMRKDFKIEHGVQLDFELPQQITLCKGQTEVFDIRTSNPKTSYQWTSSNGFTSTKGIVEISKAGIYTVKMKNELGCSVSKTMEVKESDITIDAQFIIASQTFAGEDIVLVNVSNPLGKNTEWQFPPNVKIVQKTPEGVVVRFAAPGNYKFSLNVVEGNCSKKVTKTINVQKARELSDVGEIKGKLISDFKVFPNPSRGEFKASIKLTKKAEISLRLYSLGANTMQKDKMFKGNNEYNVIYDKGIPSGVYIMLLETPRGSRIRKVIVK